MIFVEGGNVTEVTGADRDYVIDYDMLEASGQPCPLCDYVVLGGICTGCGMDWRDTNADAVYKKLEELKEIEEGY